MRRLIPYIYMLAIALLLNIPHKPTNDYVAIMLATIVGSVILIVVVAFILDVKIDRPTRVRLSGKIYHILMLVVFLLSGQTTLAILYTIGVLLLAFYANTQVKGDKNDG